MTPDADVRTVKDPNAPLERKFIDEFLRARGYDPGSLDLLPGDERRDLLQEASIFAAGKLAEFESRAHFVREIHPEQ